MCGISMPAHRIPRHQSRFCEAIALLKKQQWLIQQKIDEERKSLKYQRPWAENMKREVFNEADFVVPEDDEEEDDD
jgi:hypothetical protein